MKYPFILADVFTQQRFSGNPLAIVLEADGMPEDTMLAIAREFNLSETIFVHKPRSLRHLARVRIFTPEKELPFAGHPTVGVAVALGLRHSASAVRLEENIGTVVCVMTPSGKSAGHARFSLPKLPERVADAPDADAIAETLGLMPHQLGFDNLKPEIYSAGVNFTLVPVKDATVLREIRIQRRGWDEVYGAEGRYVYAYCATPNETDCDYAARSFVDLNGLSEDPATGSAVSALIGQLASSGRFKEGQTDFVVRQGDEMGRPSRIEAQIKLEQGQITHAGIGGHVVITGKGELDLIG